MGFLAVTKKMREEAPNLTAQYGNVQFYTPSENLDFYRSVSEVWKDSKVRTITTWAPSHVEIGLLSELLAYANIINGFKVWEREKLIPHLDISKTVFEEYLKTTTIAEDEDPLDNFMKYCSEKTFLLGREFNYKLQRNESLFCFELSQDYIGYLKEVLKPYMK